MRYAITCEYSNRRMEETVVIDAKAGYLEALARL